MTQHYKKTTPPQREGWLTPAFDLFGPISQDLKIICLFLIPGISFKSKIVLCNISEGYPAFKTTTDNLYPDELRMASIKLTRAVLASRFLPDLYASNFRLVIARRRILHTALCSPKGSLKIQLPD